VLADCFGTLEMYQDEVTKRDHLLGLDLFWQDIEEDEYRGKEASGDAKRSRVLENRD